MCDGVANVILRSTTNLIQFIITTCTRLILYKEKEGSLVTYTPCPIFAKTYHPFCLFSFSMLLQGFPNVQFALVPHDRQGIQVD